ncbi:hypothetical protein [Microbacterium hominis]|uniref:Tat pathway signal sequence domain protein n=1 Tax=Microbacterium hominis TaxID=162426 RepID=A0A7D4PTA2_9MICO|nr:hypothetical protein [Microbacterium hominis]QKJ18673.1 hypothetical protein HQM25_04250 [Microbacterium hominis]
MTDTQLSPQGDSPPPSRWRRLVTPRTLGIASGVTAGAAAVALVFATQTAVQATSSPEAPASTPIAADSTDEDAPEKAEEPIEAPESLAAAYDQLSGEEVEYVRYLGAQAEPFVDGVDVFGDPGLQFLSTDVADPASYGDGQRRMLSLYYDYGTNELVSMIVNVTDGVVEETARATGSQPAPTEAETALAWELLLDSPLGEPLHSEFATLTGGSALLPGSVEVELTAHSFTTDAGSFGAETCGLDRCVQLLAQVNGGAFLTTTPYVVNLSTQTVLSIS